MYKSIWTAILTTVAIIASEGSSEWKGAKALFEDVLTGKVVLPKATPPTDRGKGGNLPPARQTIPDIEQTPSGLMYFLELQQPDGRFVPVHRQRVFRAGERLRMQVISNVNGRLAVLQSQNGRPFLTLYPSAHTAAGGGLVKAGEPTVLPSPKGWVFDNQNGQIRLMLMVVAADESGRETKQPVAAEMPLARAENALPAPGPPPPPSARAPQGSSEDAAVRSQLDKLHGSKALVDEEAGPQAEKNPYARYVVVDPRRDPRVPRGVVAAEILIQQN